MKVYGARKATEFTRKQINVLWAKAKNGELKVEKWFLSELYNLSEYYGYDDNRTVENQERPVKKILEAVFAGNLEEAQELIDYTTNYWFNETYTLKFRNKCDRSFVC